MKSLDEILIVGISEKFEEMFGRIGKVSKLHTERTAGKNPKVHLVVVWNHLDGSGVHVISDVPSLQTIGLLTAATDKMAQHARGLGSTSLGELLDSLPSQEAFAPPVAQNPSPQSYAAIARRGAYALGLLLFVCLIAFIVSP